MIKARNLPPMNSRKGWLVVGLVVAVGAISDAAAQVVSVRPAVELSFATTPDSLHQLEVSEDLSVWRPFQIPVRGDGGPARILSAAAQNQSYFRVSTHAVRDVSGLLEPIRRSTGVPALGCAVVLSNRIVAWGVTGLRKAGITSAPVTLSDKWHHGSLTKSMTASLAAMVVEEGRIRWETTLAEVFPDWAPRMHEQWRGVTLEHLTSNRGGAPGDLNASGIWAQLWSFGGTPREGRRLLLEKLTVLPPSSPPGTRYEYSNAGFALAGAMLETTLDTPWEDLLTSRLFAPLDMPSAGFGVPATPRHIDQPWGHQWVSGRASPVEPGTAADNPPAIGPAGTVHASVIDLAKYVAWHVEGHNRGTAQLSKAVFEKLHTAYPNNASYANGWLEVERPWANPGKAYTHTGSNVQWFSVIWFAPARQFAVVAVCNVASGSNPNPGAQATDQVAGRMIGEFLD